MVSPADLIWWALQDLNLQPTDYESAALTIELRAQVIPSAPSSCARKRLSLKYTFEIYNPGIKFLDKVAEVGYPLAG
jgi:hypothetical protein